MNQKTGIWVVVIIVLVALGIWYFSSSNSGGTGAPTDMATTSATTGASGTTGGTATPVPAGSSTFHSIFTQSGNHECVYQQVAASTRSTSIIRIADGKMHGEFRTTGSVTSANIMIYNGGLLYSWKEGASVGTKSNIKTLADLPAVIPQDLTSGAVYGISSDSVGWDCHDWVTDPTMFVIPSYVTFTAA